MLVLASETSALPAAHGKLMQLLVSVARARQGKVHARLLAEHEACALLLRRLLVEQARARVRVRVRVRVS